MHFDQAKEIVEIAAQSPSFYINHPPEIKKAVETLGFYPGYNHSKLTTFRSESNIESEVPAPALADLSGNPEIIQSWQIIWKNIACKVYHELEKES